MCLLFPLQIWKQWRLIKCSDQIRVNKRDTHCFEHLQEENTKPSVNVSVSHSWIFLSPSGFYCFYRGEAKNDGTLIEWEKNVDVFVAISSFFILVENKVVKLRPLNAAIQGRYEKLHDTRNDTKKIFVRVTQFLVNSLFYTSTFIKSEFLRI